MSLSKTHIPIPDLRFEQSFLRSLDRYAASESSKRATLTKKDLNLLENEIDGDETKDITESPAPLPQVTPGIVVYAIIKDQILIPLIQGFLWSGFLLCVRPFLGAVVASGQRWGTWVAHGIGISARRRR